jgi:hypothetical protein
MPKMKNNPLRCLSCEETKIRDEVPECWKSIMQLDKNKKKGYSNSICFSCMNNNGYKGHTTDGRKYYIKRYDLVNQKFRDTIPEDHTKGMGWKTWCALFFYNGDEYTYCCDTE